MDPDSLKVAHKEFNKPAEYASILDLLAKYDVYAITSFIYGMEADRPGVARKTIEKMANWPPGLPVFGLLTPYPATPLYDRLQREGRLTRPEHWLDFQAFKTAFTPKTIAADEAEAEVCESWRHCYSPEAFSRAQHWMLDHQKPFEQQLALFIARLLFRGVYFPQMTRWSWIRLLAQNFRTLVSLTYSGIRERRSLGRPSRLPGTVSSPESFGSLQVGSEEPGDV